jgi:uncharacterized membrane protein YraQ (UPF0718 family)
VVLFGWLNDQLLKMEWLWHLVGLLVEGVFRLDLESKLGGSVQFFIYDVIKILISLAVLVFGISYIQSFFPPERTKRILGRFRGITANLLAALLGTVTPFCSCSSIPLFIGFTNAGLPLAVTFSFLISSPLVDLASLILLAGTFGWTTAIAYVAVGVVLAVVAGTIIGNSHLEAYVEPFVFSTRACACSTDEVADSTMTVSDRLAYARDQTTIIVRKVWLYVLMGVGIGAVIHNWIPERFIAAILGQDKWYSVPLATLVGVPMYSDVFTTLPIAEALVAKGVGLGTALSFMMAVTALSAPSIIMLKRVIKTRLLVLFVGIVAVGIMLIGFAFNAFGRFLG